MNDIRILGNTCTYSVSMKSWVGCLSAIAEALGMRENPTDDVVEFWLVL